MTGASAPKAVLLAGAVTSEGLLLRPLVRRDRSPPLAAEGVASTIAKRGARAPVAVSGKTCSETARAEPK
jgi:hypothetical protein